MTIPTGDQLNGKGRPALKAGVAQISILLSYMAFFKGREPNTSGSFPFCRLAQAGFSPLVRNVNRSKSSYYR
jgi:hypothetical protein